MALTQSSEEGLKISNAGTNGQYLQKQSGNTGGLTWADVPAGVGGATGVAFNDNIKARFGTGNDLEIYHDGTNTYQVNTTGSLVHRSTGEIYIQSDAGVRLTDVGGNETFLKCIDNGAVELYHDNSKKAETTADGLTISGVTVSTGNIQINNDTGKIRLGASQDLNIYHDGSHSYISDTGTGDLYIRSSKVYIQSGEGNNENIITGAADGAVELYYNNAKKFETNNTGATWTGDLTTVDSGVLKFGTSGDLQLYHDGSHSYINDAGTGDLKIISDGNGVMLQKGTTETLARFLVDGACELYYNDVKKVETTAEGFFFDGTGGDTYWLGDSIKWRYTDNVKGCYGTSDDLQIYHDGTDSRIKNSTGQLILQGDDLLLRNEDSDETYLRAQNDGGVEVYHDNSVAFKTQTEGIRVDGSENRVIFGSDTDTYIKRAAANEIAVHTGGSERLRVQNDQILIGTTSSQNNNASGIGYADDVQIVASDSNNPRGLSVVNTNGGNYAYGRLVVGNIKSDLGNAESTSIISLSGNRSWPTIERVRLVGKVSTTNTSSYYGGEFRIEVSADGAAGTSERFRIERDGDLLATDTSIGSLSDQRLKKNINNYTYDLSKFKGFKPKTYDWINPEYHQTRTQIPGFVAQDIQATDANWVKEVLVPDTSPKDNEIVGDKALSSKLGEKDAMYISVIQQLITKIETLETKVAALEAA